VKKKALIALGSGIFVILAVLAFFLLTKSGNPERVEKVRVGVFADSICSLVYIAQEQGFFKRHGLDLAIENYQAGVFAVDDLLAGKLDLATATEFVLALKGLKAADLRAVGTISETDTVKVVAGRDRGVEKPEDLRGKLIGTTKNTVSEFFLHTFLSFNGILPAEVRMVDLKPSEIVTALSEGKIDAASCFTPFAETVEKNLAEKAISWSAQGGQNYFFLMITREELIRSRPQMVTGLLKGLLEAEAFLKNHEKQAQNIVERVLGLDHEVVLNNWAKTRFRVRLDQNLLTLMEDEARWAMRSKLVEGEKIPNYFSFLHLEGLKKIKPEAVSVIH
jgi:ABC-type nitrate/sulfonate/bicarbonate transport system substrate-binding protein